MRASLAQNTPRAASVALILNCRGRSTRAPLPVHLCLGDPALPPLPPIRFLHYFVPLLEEVLATPLALEYVQYLRSKLAALNP